MVIAMLVMTRSWSSGSIMVLMSGVIFCTLISWVRTNKLRNALATPLTRCEKSPRNRANSASSIASGKFITITGCAPPSKNAEVKRSR